MKPLISLCAVLFCISAIPIQDNAVKDELKRLQGHWVRVSCHADGQLTEDGDRPPDKQVKLEITSNRFASMPFVIDVTKTPYHIDLQDVGPKGKQFTLPGIYELKGDVLKICLPFPFEGKYDQIHKRPTEFVSKKGENHVVEVYRRETK